MKISEIKKEMLEYVDFYGGDIPDIDSIKQAKTKKELAKVLNNHESFLEDQLADAKSHLSRFRKKLGLHCVA